MRHLAAIVFFALTAVAAPQSASLMPHGSIGSPTKHSRAQGDHIPYMSSSPLSHRRKRLYSSVDPISPSHNENAPQVLHHKNADAFVGVLSRKGTDPGWNHEQPPPPGLFKRVQFNNCEPNEKTAMNSANLKARKVVIDTAKTFDENSQPAIFQTAFGHGYEADLVGECLSELNALPRVHSHAVLDVWCGSEEPSGAPVPPPSKKPNKIHANPKHFPGNAVTDISVTRSWFNLSPNEQLASFIREVAYRICDLADSYEELLGENYIEPLRTIPLDFEGYDGPEEAQPRDIETRLNNRQVLTEMSLISSNAWYGIVNHFIPHNITYLLSDAYARLTYLHQNPILSRKVLHVHPNVVRRESEKILGIDRKKLP